MERTKEGRKEKKPREGREGKWGGGGGEGTEERDFPNVLLCAQRILYLLHALP